MCTAGVGGGGAQNGRADAVSIGIRLAALQSGNIRELSNGG